MILKSIINSILRLNKIVDLQTLPTQGLFYPDDFKMWIKKANIDDITEYEYQFKNDDLGTILNKMGKIIRNNTIFSSGYYYDDIKSVDRIYLFIEIVKFTNNKPFLVDVGMGSKVEFSNKTFNYFDLGNNIEYYDNTNKCISIDGFKYTLPTIGTERCITNYIISKSGGPDVEKYEKYSYDFIYFLGQKSNLSESEIDNLINIFNHDLSDDDKEKISSITKSLSYIQKYSLMVDYKVIDLSSFLTLDKVWA